MATDAVEKALAKLAEERRALEAAWMDLQVVRSLEVDGRWVAAALAFDEIKTRLRAVLCTGPVL